MPYQSANALLVNKCSGARFIRDVVISLSRRQPHCGQRESDKPFALRSVSRRGEQLLIAVGEHDISVPALLWIEALRLRLVI
jgi:hypothetical protein